MKRFTLWLGIVFSSFIIGMGLVSLFWTPYDPIQVVPAKRLMGSSLQHPLGTDGFGIDTLSRLLVGSQTSLMVGAVSVAVAALVGIPLGILAGMRSGWITELVLRGADIMYAFPALLIAILLAAAIGASGITALVAVSIATIPTFIRIAYATTTQVMSLDYVTAARSCGTRGVAIGLRHVLPNIAPPLGIQASISFGIAILAEAALSYLGLGTPPPTPTWGRMLRDAQGFIFNDPMQAVWPGLAIAIAVLGCNLLADALRDYLDPSLVEMR